MRSNNFLASFFQSFREVVENAETPFAKLAIVILPIIAPLVPALLTGIRMQILLLNLIGDKLDKNFASGGAFTISVVLELLGYVGAVMFVRSIYNLIKNKSLEYYLPVFLTAIAYIFYLADMYAINVQLNNDVPNTTVVFGLLSFMTVPTGLLAATSINERQEKEQEYETRQEQRQDKMERFRIKHTGSKTTSESNMEVPKQFQNNNGTMGRPSIHQERVFSFMEQYYQSTKKVATFTEVMTSLNLPQSTASRLRDKWIASKNNN